MSKEKIYIFDTTLRDGAQTEGVDFSLDDKTKIAVSLSEIGIDFIEGGWPGANPSDTNFFNDPPKLNSNLVAFGMTKRSGRSCENDPGISSIVNAILPFKSKSTNLPWLLIPPLKAFKISLLRLMRTLLGLDTTRIPRPIPQMIIISPA